MGRLRRTKLGPGIYDEVLDEHVRQQLERLDPDLLFAVHHSIKRDEEVGPALITRLHEAIELAFLELREKPSDAIGLAQELLDILRRRAPRPFKKPEELQLLSQRLTAIIERPAKELSPPRGSLHRSALIVNAEGESLLDHLRSEFATSDRVDLLCAFLKLSGYEKFREVLEAHCVGRGRQLRVLTTTYMQATEAKAVERFAALSNAAVKVSFDEAATRLHAKAWIFHRGSGYSTAYVGSSNLSHAAQTEGLEWNVRLTESDQPALLAQMSETFEQYWADADQFEAFDKHDEKQVRRLHVALSMRDAPRDGLLIELEPKDYQKPVLAELSDARRLGRHRNLLVAATGTGKTVMAALDYKRLKESGSVDTLLYVAHRREILDQARDVFRSALQVQSFGELFFQGHVPSLGRHVFASIDSIMSGGVIDPATFDMVVVDEAHHSAAESWELLLRRVTNAKEVLGLTGTPERADGLDYEQHFPRPWVGNLRLWTAIPHALVPFRYYMLDVDGVDLSDVTWRGGRYAPEALSTKLVTAAEIFVKKAMQAMDAYIARPDNMRAIAFCSSVRHAEEVCARFLAKDRRARVLTGTTDKQARARARDDLDAGTLEILCVVDLYNEGVDLPNVNTLMFFRPTESATVFLQQLGRGLRRAPMKSELVVFDLTGRQRHEFRFDRRLRAATGHTAREVRDLVKTGFGRLPAGCHFHFDRISREDVLAQLQRSIPSDLRGIEALLKEPAHSELSLISF
jgi:superfamily II DNA or RNA helicase/HKD family nuclease